jgi:hypothetical protein
MLKDNAPVHYNFSDKPVVDDWPSNVKPLAFRVASGILVVNILMNIGVLVLGQAPNIIALVVDGILAISLFLLHPGARGFTLFRAYAGGILLPILAFWQHDPLTAVILSIVQVFYSGALILLLQGETKNWKVITAICIFGVFCVGISLCLFSVVLLAKATLK